MIKCNLWSPWLLSSNHGIIRTSSYFRTYLILTTSLIQKWRPRGIKYLSQSSQYVIDRSRTRPCLLLFFFLTMTQWLLGCFSYDTVTILHRYGILAVCVCGFFLTEVKESLAMYFRTLIFSFFNRLHSGNTQEVFYRLKWKTLVFKRLMQQVTNRGKPSTAFWINSLRFSPF